MLIPLRIGWPKIEGKIYATTLFTAKKGNLVFYIKYILEKI